MRILTACFISGLLLTHPSFANTEPVLVSVVDEQQQPMQVDIIRWWYSDTPQQKYYLNCANDDCDQWQISEALTAEVIIHATASKPHEEDSMCSHVYSGELSYLPGVEIATEEEPTASEMALPTELILKHAGLVCQ